MGKNFANARGAKIIDEVAKMAEEKAQVITLKMIKSENLFDYPKNHEDVKDTADLENSIKELGFTDPIEVTGYSMNEGDYTIVSGHRRRAAGVKCGIDTFPCIVKTFENDEAVNNYVLLANSQRDSSKDPLLFCTRFKMHEEFLKAAGFSGNIRLEVAKRLGISPAQADRYNAMNKIILPVWDMVRDEVVGMSSVQPMATFEPNEQEKIVAILRECVSSGGELTRNVVKLIVDEYKKGIRTWAAINEDKPTYKDSGLPLNSMIGANVESGSASEGVKTDRNNEIRREIDPIAAEADYKGEKRKTLEVENGNEDGGGDSGENEEKPESGAGKSRKAGKDIEKTLEKLNILFSNLYEFDNKDVAETAIRNMSTTFTLLLDEIYNVSREYDLTDIGTELIGELKMKIKKY